MNIITYVECAACQARRQPRTKTLVQHLETITTHLAPEGWEEVLGKTLCHNCVSKMKSLMTEFIFTTLISRGGP